MKNQIKLSILLALLGSFSACNKKSDIAPSKTKSCKILNYFTNDPTIISKRFDYADNRKLSRITETSTGNYIDFIYGNSTIEVTNYYKTTNEYVIRKYTLDSKGRAIKETTSSGNTYTFEYNAAGFLTKTFNNGNILSIYTYLNGNRIKNERFKTNGNNSVTWEFKYDLNTLNKTPDISGFEVVFGNSSKNVINKITQIVYPSNTSIASTTDKEISYKNKFDAKGNLSEVETTTIEIGNPQITTTATTKYEYSCD